MLFIASGHVLCRVLTEEGFMQLDEMASAQAKELGGFFLFLYPGILFWTKASVGRESEVRLFRRWDFKFPECRGGKRVCQVKAVNVTIIDSLYAL